MSRRLVAYFSAGGVTAAAATVLADAAGADLYEIRPARPYSRADLDWNDKNSRSSVEMRDKASRPAMADGESARVEGYDVIFLGFPIWWYVAPTIINTYLESGDFSDKTIILFATSGGSGFGRTAEYLRGSVSPSAVIREGRLLNGRLSADELRRWVDSLGLPD